MESIEPRFVVKVCGITEEVDALAALQAGANALGFNFYRKGRRYITPSRAAEIVRNVPGQYLKVGVFVNATVADLLAIADEAQLDVLQLHGEKSAIPDTALRIWRAIRGDRPVPERDTRVEAYLLDTHTPEFGGSGQTFDWSLASNFPYRAIVAGGLDGSNVADAIATLQPWGVDACSRIESQPGRKDQPRMLAFIRAALEGSESQHSQKTGSL